MISIELTITLDFLSKLVRTNRVSRYSPTAKEIAERCMKAYPAPSGLYKIVDGDVIEAAKQLGITNARNKKWERSVRVVG